jgi:hypothetical protein
MADLRKVEICRISGALMSAIILILSGGTAGAQHHSPALPYKPTMGMDDPAPSEVNRSTNTHSGSPNSTRFISGLAKFAATPIYAGTPATASFLSVLGSRELPAATLDATAIFQKTSTGATSGSQTNGTAYFSATKTGSSAGSRATGILSEALASAGGAGSFVEGARFHGSIGATGAGEATGAVAVGQNLVGSTYTYLLAFEGAVENSTADAPTIFDHSHFAVSYLATNAQAGSSKISDAGFLTNPFNPKPFRVGYLVGKGSVDNAAFRSLANTGYGIDLSGGTQSFCSICIPNRGVIRSLNQAQTVALNVMYLSSDDALTLGTDTHGITLPAVSEPATPGPGFFRIYMDATDNKLKAKGPNGTVTVLANP